MHPATLNKNPTILPNGETPGRLGHPGVLQKRGKEVVLPRIVLATVITDQPSDCSDLLDRLA
jgi:hypothetical protein